MRLFTCSTDKGSVHFVFTTDEERARQLFAIHIVLGNDRPSKFWLGEATVDTVLPGQRDHLRTALSQGLEAFSTYSEQDGWVMHPVQDTFDQLTEQAAGGVQ